MTLKIDFTEKPTARNMSRAPIKYKATLKDGAVEAQGRIRAGVYIEKASMQAGFNLAYEEERDSPACFDISSVVDAELNFEIPLLGLTDAHLATNVGKRFFVATRYADEEENIFIHTHSVSENTYMVLSQNLTATRAYRLSAVYFDNYEDEDYSLRANTNELSFFAGNEYLHEGRIVEIIFAEEPYSEIKLPTSTFELEISELPADTLRWAIKGRETWLDINTNSPPSFLTSMPKERLFLLSQEAWLWWSLPDPASTREFTFECQYSDGSMLSGTKTFNTASSQPYQVWAFPISDLAMGYTLLDPSKTIERIVIQGIGQEVVLKVEAEGLPYLREFHFNNRLGGTDWLIAYGKGQRNDEWMHEEYRKFAEVGGRTFGKRHTADRTKFTVSAGYRSKQERDAAFDLLRAEQAHIREDGRMIPINVLSKKTSNEKDGDRRYSLSFEYAYAFEN